MLISRGKQNLFSWNEELDRNPPWIPTRLNVPSIAAPAPDGRSAASIINEGTDLATTHHLSRTVTLAYGVRYTESVYAKLINRNWLYITCTTAAGSPFVSFNLNTGAVGTTGGVLDYAEAIDVGDGWYRCWYTFVNDQNAAVTRWFFLAEADNDVTFSGLDQNSLYLWRPQINEGWGPDSDFLVREVSRS